MRALLLVLCIVRREVLGEGHRPTQGSGAASPKR
jgi:hypothetical protein